MSCLEASLQQQVLARAAGASGDAEVLAVLGELEELKNTIAAAQARLAVRLREQRVAERGHLPSVRRTRGVGAEVGLARRESPHRGSRHLSLGWVLCRELPHTLAAMEAGRCTEWSATLVARATACLSREDRRRVDESLMADPGTTAGWGERRLEAEADAIAYRLDPEAAVRRRAAAVAERHVSLRPVPGVEGVAMTRLSALLPLEAGAATLAALDVAAEQARGTGDPTQPRPGDGRHPRRSGRRARAARLRRRVRAGGARRGRRRPRRRHPPRRQGSAGDQAGWVDGVPLPAQTVRDLVARAHAYGLATLRRLYAHPSTGSPVAMDSRARAFPAGLARFLDRHDRSCRTPFCDAPIRHHDHIRAFVGGGGTSAANGEGLCEACNYARQAAEFRPPPVPAPSPPTPLAPPPRLRVELQWHAA